MFGLEKAVQSVGLVSRGGMPGSLVEALTATEVERAAIVGVICRNFT